MGQIFDFEGEKNIIGVIAPIPKGNSILAALWICQLAKALQGKKNILFRSPQISSPDPTRSQRIGSASP
jgi:hypothetical protein